MKPVVLAKNHCANFLHGGTCNGVDFKRPGLKQFRFLPEGAKCLLARGRRCSYFETAVMLALSPKQLLDYKEKFLGMKVYRPPEPQRRCPNCDGPIGHRMRYCFDCRRLQSNKSQAKWRAKKA